jgi:hypothetical protein
MKRSVSYQAKVGFLILGAVALFFITVVHIKKETLFDMGVNAYIYAYPLLLMDVTKQTMTQEGKYINTFIHSSEFPTDTFKNIVRPNVDTLYSFAWLDLSREPLMLSVPDTHGRYYLIEFLDAWTNVFASVGKRTTGTAAHTCCIVGPDWKGNLPEHVTIIKAPTNMVLLLGRIQTYGKKEYSQVHALQAEFTLRSLSTHGNAPTHHVAPERIQRQAPVDQVAALDAVQFYTRFARVFKQNSAPLIDEPMLAQLKKIGIEQGKDFDPSILPTDGLAILNSSMKKAYADIRAVKNSIHTVHGWAVMLHIGTYGTDYLTRAMIAYMGIGANLPEDAVYPTVFFDADNRPLTGVHQYRIHFDKGQLPPARAFWSLTLYNAQSFLVKNELNRYALNNKDPLRFNKDGSLDLYMQHVSPGKEKESNWLPAPEGDFNLTMRLYWPEKSVLDGTWQPPALQKIA